MGATILDAPAEYPYSPGYFAVYFTDPDGLLIQLQDVKYCGGSGFLGDVCP